MPIANMQQLRKSHWISSKNTAVDPFQRGTFQPLTLLTLCQGPRCRPLPQPVVLCFGGSTCSSWATSTHSTFKPVWPKESSAGSDADDSPHHPGCSLPLPSPPRQTFQIISIPFPRRGASVAWLMPPLQLLSNRGVTGRVPTKVTAAGSLHKRIASRSKPLSRPLQPCWGGNVKLLPEHLQHCDFW